MNNVLQKLGLIRAQVQALSKSAKNSYVGFAYFELEDIVPAIDAACTHHQCGYAFNFKDGVASITFVDLVSGEQLETQVPFVWEGSVARATPTQCIGSALTYYRRYLLLLLFNILEKEKVDCQPRQSEPRISKPIVLTAKDAPITQTLSVKLADIESIDQLKELWLSISEEERSLAGVLQDFQARAKELEEVAV